MRHWGPEADLWSLGMVAYLLLSGVLNRRRPSAISRRRAAHVPCVVHSPIEQESNGPSLTYCQRHAHVLLCIPPEASLKPRAVCAGRMPFWGGAASGIPPFMVMQEILGADIKFDGDAWAGISEDAVDFVDKLLDRDFNTRMTAEQVGFVVCVSCLVLDW